MPEQTRIFSIVTDFIVNNFPTTISQEMQKGSSSVDASDRLSAKINFLTDTIFADLSEEKDWDIIVQATGAPMGGSNGGKWGKII